MKFNTESPFFQFLNTLSSFIALNVVFLITCLPIFTIGPSLCALYDVTMREARGEYGYLIKPYFKAFRQNFKKGTLLFLILAALGMILLFNITFWSQLGTTMATVITFVLALAVGAYLLVLLYAFALMARFENSLRQTMSNAFHLAVLHWKQTVPLLLILAVAVAACMFIPQAKIFMLLLGFSFIAYCESFFFIKVFKNYEPEEEDESNPLLEAMKKTAQNG
ncbi:MAG: DUF624 domain-containing protein [Eubacteriales bacterium]|nr:DUF624 domain-containing protein [Eubacteriales bacterium]